MEGTGRKVNFKSILFLQLIIIVYTFSSVFEKMATHYDFMSGMFILFIVLTVVVLGTYALLWQQALKRFDLHVAYANREMAVIWGMVWSALIFQERITAFNLIGTAIIIAGVVLVNWDAE